MAFVIPIAGEVALATAAELETLLAVGEAGAVVAAESSAAVGDAVAIAGAGSGVLVAGAVAAGRDEWGVKVIEPPTISQKRPRRPSNSSSGTGVSLVSTELIPDKHWNYLGNQSFDTYSRKRRYKRFRRF